MTCFRPLFPNFGICYIITLSFRRTNNNNYRFCSFVSSVSGNGSPTRKSSVTPTLCYPADIWQRQNGQGRLSKRSRSPLIKYRDRRYLKVRLDERYIRIFVTTIVKYNQIPFFRPCSQDLKVFFEELKLIDYQFLWIL